MKNETTTIDLSPIDRMISFLTMRYAFRYEIQEPTDQYFSLCFSVADDPLDPAAEWLSTAEIFDVIKQKVGSSLQVNTLIAFGRKLANMPGMRRRKCETCTRYLVKRVGQ